MKKLKKYIILSVLIALVGGGFYLSLLLPVATGYAAKNLCSCAFIADREPDHVNTYDINFFPLNLASNRVDYDNKKAFSTILGMFEQVAIYREGLGCTLLQKKTEDFMRVSADNFKPQRPEKPDPNLPWPAGNAIADSIPEYIDLQTIDQVVLEAFKNDDPEKPKNTHAVAIIHDGKLIYERYREPFTKDTEMLGWSMTKSVTSALVGILHGQGKLDPMAPAPIDEWKDDARKNITLHHLLQMQSGLTWEEEYGSLTDVTKMLYLEGDMYAFARKAPYGKDPGTNWYYSSGTSNIIAGLVKDQFKSLPEYWQFPYSSLFNKIGMHTMVMEPDEAGLLVGSSYSFATVTDWARFAQLYMQEGVWDGERILPEGWVKYTTTPASDAPVGQYGAQFWLNAGEPDNIENRRYPDVPADAFLCEGFKGQRIFMIPSKKTIILRFGMTDKGNFDHNIFARDILAAIDL